jgi:hypothetical protein
MEIVEKSHGTLGHGFEKYKTNVIDPNNSWLKIRICNSKEV